MVPPQLSKDLSNTPFLNFVCVRVYKEQLDQFFIFKINTFKVLSINNIYRDFINIIEIIHLWD
jgi:hypothetical protein